MAFMNLLPSVQSTPFHRPDQLPHGLNNGHENQPWTGVCGVFEFATPEDFLPSLGRRISIEGLEPTIRPDEI